MGTGVCLFSNKDGTCEARIHRAVRPSVAYLDRLISQVSNPAVNGDGYHGRQSAVAGAASRLRNMPRWPPRTPIPEVSEVIL